VERLVREKALSDKIRDYLAGQLLKITHRTYLWVYLVFDYLKTEGFKKTVKGVQSSIKTLPKNIDQAYERILNKSKEHLMVRKVLSIIIAANRPLTLSEMNLAVNIDESVQNIRDLDLEEEDDFKSRLRSWCGLFVSVHHGKIYFLHQTAREFLLANLPLYTTISTELQWQHSITIHQAHNILAELCVRYLNFFNSDGVLADTDREVGHHIDSHAFLNYAASFWSLHFREAYISNNDEEVAIIGLVLRVSDPHSKAFSAWSKIHWKNQIYFNYAGLPTVLTVASYFGHINVVTLLLKKGTDLETKDSSGMTPLSWAADHGYEAIVKLLVEKGADIESKNNYNWTPLAYAAVHGHEAVVRLLVEKGANLESKDSYGQTPLSRAAQNGYRAIVKLLVGKGADMESKDNHGSTPLSLAVEEGQKAVVKLLEEYTVKTST